jgi:predicted DNA-binding transcriptional regulator YafY
MNAKHSDRLYKSDRLNYIVNRMRLRQDITPAMLATELHVSERTIYRDLRYLEKGNTLKKRYSRREGRYMLETELQLPPLVLTPSEALALFTASSNPALAKGNFYADDLRSGLSKLAQLLSAETHREMPESEPEFLHGYAVVSEPISVTTNSILRPTLEMIQRAMSSNRKLRYIYWSSASDRAEEVIAAPYDVRHDGPNWFLLAQPDRAEARVYRIVRMRGLEILPDRFRYPRRFSADSFFARAMEAHGKQDEEIRVKIRFSTSVADVVLGSRSQQFAAIDQEADGSVICTLLVSSTREIVWWILSFGIDAEVIEPQSLRDECCKIATTMAQLYQETVGTSH